jgi:hypothetical protein
MRQNTLEAKIRLVLADRPQTRNDGVALQISLIEKYGSPSDIIRNPVFNDCLVRVSALRNFREDHVKRIRAKIQNEDGDFLPTDPEIRKKRKILEADWEEYTRKSGVSFVDGGNPSFT